MRLAELGLKNQREVVVAARGRKGIKGIDERLIDGINREGCRSCILQISRCSFSHFSESVMLHSLRWRRLLHSNRPDRWFYSLDFLGDGAGGRIRTDTP